MSTRLRKHGKRIIILLVATSGIAATFVATDRLLQIKEIQISGAPVHIAIDQKKLPRSLLFFPTQRVKNTLLSSNPILSGVTITKKYPHTLIITLSIREPFARLETNGKQFLVDGSGMVLSENVSGYQTLPIVTMNLHDPAFPIALNFIKETRTFFGIVSVRAFDSTSLLATIGNTDIVFPQKNEPREISATLQTLFSGFRIKGTLPTRIDLRFGKPIVTF